MKMPAWMPPSFPVEKWLENLLLDEYREAYSLMTPTQQACVRKAYLYGYLTKEREIKEKNEP
jgi:hypothetical protein